MAQQRKGASQRVGSHRAGKEQKGASILEAQPANSILSNQNTDESSAHPKNEDQRNNSYHSSQQNLPKFPAKTLNAKASGQGGLEPPRSNFFDPAQFPKKKRSSAIPKRTRCARERCASRGRWRPREGVSHNLSHRSRSALAMTDSELKLIAAPAIIGLRSVPVRG